ncbi:MAG: ATPase [Granulosicoccus sp.]|nr:ATPase [Granulosicoccus sp.]
MNMAECMTVSLHIPSRTLFHGPVTRLNAVSPRGGFGILPNHVDFVTAIVPCVLELTLEDARQCLFGIDEGLLVKQHHHVKIAVRRAVESTDLDTLTDTVTNSFADIDDRERTARTALSRLEANMVRRFVNLRRTLP